VLLGSLSSSLPVSVKIVRVTFFYFENIDVEPL
jgi:hypothetical protein